MEFGIEMKYLITNNGKTRTCRSKYNLNWSLFEMFQVQRHNSYLLELFAHKLAPNKNSDNVKIKSFLKL
jgi:hypothetical protein